MNHDEAHGLRVQLATALREAEELRDAADTWLSERDALRGSLEELRSTAATLMVERDALRADAKRLLESAAALRDGYDHVAHCRECGEMSVEHCAKAEGENSDAAKAIEARIGIDAALAGGGDRG